MNHFNRLLVMLLFTFLAAQANAQFAKGADVSWVTQMENSGFKFYNNSGQQQDLFTILKNKGINTIRLRVWLNPWEGWCAKQDVLTKAIRAKNAGMRIMIDFHYSDYWADPGQQTKPVAWQNYSFTQLTSAVSTHTTDVLNTLKSNGIVIEWVQVGNETNDGLLWEEGRASTNMRNYALLINAGYDAVKSVYPSAKVIVHVSNGYDNALFRWNFDGLKANGAKWDVVGMSLYPTKANWQSMNTQCLANMKDMVTRYGKQVMVVEVGMEARQAADCKSFLTDLMNKTASIQNGAGLGVVYWEPQCHNRWQGYSKGAFDDKGRPTVALDAFLASILSTSSLSTTSGDESENALVLSTWPNPTHGYITIGLPSHFSEDVKLSIYNGKGESVITALPVVNNQVVDVSSLSSGFLLVSAHDRTSSVTKKIIKD